MQIFLRNVHPVFLEKEKTARSGVWGQDVKLNASEHVHIIAPSGSGKTSLIHFLYGLRKDYNGSILYDADNISQFDAEKFSVLRRQHISIVFQDLRLFAEQTVWQNLEIKRLLLPYHATNPIVAMAQKLGIENKLDKLCKTCSYGEQQRISIIRSMLQPFDFLLLDEPFSHLDDSNRSIAMQMIHEEAAARNASIILADLRKIEAFNAASTLYL